MTSREKAERGVLERAKSRNVGEYVGRMMAVGDADQAETAFRLFAAQAQRLKDAERLRKMIPGD